MFLNDVGQIRTCKFGVTTSAKILASENVISRKITGRHTVEISNTGAGIVYLGNSGVTTSTGLPIKAGESKIIPVDISSIDNLYVVGSAAQDIILAEYFA